VARGRTKAAVDTGPVEGPWELPKGWRWERLGSLADLLRGVSYNKRQAHEVASADTVPLLRGGNIQYGSVVHTDLLYVDRKCVSDDQLLHDKDIILTMSSGSAALVGKSAWVSKPTGELTFGAFCACLRSHDIDQARWLFWFLQTPFYRQSITGSAKGTSINNLKREHLGGLPIPIPPAIELPLLVARIDSWSAEIDEGEIALADARSGVETYRKALLKAAVTGELTADWRRANPPQESGEQLLTRLLANRRADGHIIKKSQAGERIAEDDLPSLPESWIWCRNEQAGKIQLGRQRTPKDHSGPHMRPYLRVANVYEDRIDLSDVKQMNFTPTEFENFRLQQGDILLNEGQSLELVGRPAMFRGEVDACCFQNTLVRFQAGQYVDPDYALLTFLYAMHSGRFKRIAKITTNIAHLGAGRFAELGFPLAPLDEQLEAVRLYHAHMKRFETAISTLSATSVLRQSILAAAFRGELAV